MSKKSLMPGYGEERMQEDTVGNGPFGYTASETYDEDAKKESFSFFKDRCRGQRESWVYIVHNLHFTQQQSNVSPLQWELSQDPVIQKENAKERRL